MSYAPRTVRTLLVSAAVAALVVGGRAVAQSTEPAAPISQAVERSPFLGIWELDLTRMPDSYGPPPKRVTFAFEDVGSGEWLTKVEITAPDDSVRHVAVKYRRDGRAVRGEGDPIDGDIVAVHSPAPNVLVFGMGKDKKLIGARTYAVSADGQEMTESATSVDDAGTPFVRNFHFKRVR